MRFISFLSVDSFLMSYRHSLLPKTDRRHRGHHFLFFIIALINGNLLGVDQDVFFAVKNGILFHRASLRLLKMSACLTLR